MRKLVLALFDVKAHEHGALLVVPSVGVGFRILGDMLKSKDSEESFVNHPEDFRVVLVGEYDVLSGRISSEEIRPDGSSVDLPRVLCELTELVPA